MFRMGKIMQKGILTKLQTEVGRGESSNGDARN